MIGNVRLALLVLISTSIVSCGGEVACACSGAPVTQAASPTPTPRSALASGIYVDGIAGTPHYFVTVTAKSDGTATGTVSFLHQDGQTEAAFTFTATVQSGIATLTASTGRIITAPFDQHGFTLGNCTDYLPYARTNADCSFTFSPNGLTRYFPLKNRSSELEDGRSRHEPS